MLKDEKGVQINSYPGTMSNISLLEPHNPVKQETAEQVVKRKDLSTDRVEPDQMGETKYCAGKYCARDEIGDSEKD